MWFDDEMNKRRQEKLHCAGFLCVIKGGVCGLHCVSFLVKPEWHLPGLLWYILDAGPCLCCPLLCQIKQ